MKKLNQIHLKRLLILGLFCQLSIFFVTLTAQETIRVSLAEWTFDKWYGGGVLPPGQTIQTPIFPDRGQQAATVCLGTEQMFAQGNVTRVWDVPTTGGYVRCNKEWNNAAERYYMVTGISTIGCSSIRLTSSHATSSTSQTYSMKVQYRIGSNGVWTDFFGPFVVNDVTESGINRKQVNEVELPTVCQGQSVIDLRWLVTTFPSSTSTQFRLDNIYLTACIANPDPNADKTALNEANALNVSDWTIPSWTRLLTARKKASEAPITANLQQLKTVMSEMQPKNTPYCVVASYNGDPCTRIGFAWYTNADVNNMQVQLVQKINATESDFSSPLISVSSTTKSLSDINYLVSANDPVMTAGLSTSTKRSYVSHKALVTGLTPGTNYSYRVGKDGAWSAIGTFRTVPIGNESFSFLYLTDSQANSVDNFTVSSSSLKQAYAKASNPLFALFTGDLVESAQGSSLSEWEYEQWFESMGPIWRKIPVVATIGNHDSSSKGSFYDHFNNDNSYNRTAAVPSTMDGTNYSFVVGDALFLVCNHENVGKEGYLESLCDWMRAQVAANATTRWRIVCVHSGLFSGGSHYDDVDAAKLRQIMLPVYQELHIDLAIQGHDHVYNVIGPVNAQNKTAITGAAYNFDPAVVNVPANMNGRAGGVYDVSQGTLYFINNSASRKKYSTISRTTMNGQASTTLIPDYWSLFTGHYGQTGEPTFSEVKVTNNYIEIITYAINNSGETYLFDRITVTKTVSSISRIHSDSQPVVIYDKDNKIVKVLDQSVDRLALYDTAGMLCGAVNNGASLALSNIPNGLYFVHILDQGKCYNSKMLVY